MAVTRRDLLKLACAGLLFGQAPAAPTGLRLLTPAVAHHMTYYVSTSGSDSNPGTLAQPFRTIAHGLSVLHAGDTLSVKAGTYAEALTSFPSGTSWSSPVTIAAYPGDTVIIRPSGVTAGNVLTFATGSPSYVVVDGFVLDADDTVFSGLENAGGGVYVGGGAHHIRVQNCEIKNAPGQGVMCVGGPQYNEFLNLDVHDNGLVYQLTHGFYISSANNLIEGCRAYNNAAYGLQVYSDIPSHIHDNVIRKCSFYNNTVMGNGGGLDLSGSRNVAYNNIMWGNNGGYAITVGFAGPFDNQVLNNTVTGQYGILINSDSVRAVVRNNIIFVTTDGVVNNGTGSVISNNLLTDPDFVDAGAHDFHLSPTSAAIDAGTSLGDVGLDFDGIVRPQGTGFDIGAYEYSATAFPVPVASVAVLPGIPTTHRVTWTQAGTFTGTYAIYRSTGIGSTTFEPITTGIAYTDPKTFDVTDIVPGTTYRYKVVATQDADTAPSAVVAVGTLPINASNPCCAESVDPPVGPHNGGTTPGEAAPLNPYVSLPPWTRLCGGGGTVPTAASIVDVENWAQ